MINFQNFRKNNYLRFTCAFICVSLEPRRNQALRDCQRFFKTVDGVDGLLTLVLTAVSGCYQRFKVFVDGVDAYILTHDVCTCARTCRDIGVNTVNSVNKSIFINYINKLVVDASVDGVDACLLSACKTNKIRGFYGWG